MQNDSSEGYQVVEQGMGRQQTQIVSSLQYVFSFFFHTLLTSIYKYSVPPFLFINAIQYLKHDTLIIMIIKYGTRILRCTQNTSRRSLNKLTLGGFLKVNP